MRSARSALRFTVVLAASLVKGPAFAEPPREQSEASPPATPAATSPAVPVPAPPAPVDAGFPLSSRLARGAVARALEVAGHPRSRRELASLGSRTRTAALLPQVTLRALRSTDQSLKLTPTFDEPDRYSESGGAGLWLEGRLTWQLDRLMYDRDELAVLRAQGELGASAVRLTGRVLDALFAWQRALRRAALAPLPEEGAEARLAAHEAEIMLDVLTGGWFGKELGRMAAEAAR